MAGQAEKTPFPTYMIRAPVETPAGSNCANSVVLHTIEKVTLHPPSRCLTRMTGSHLK